MDLAPPLPPSHLRSATQRVRWASEEWGARELYCPVCPADRLQRLPNNARARDFICPECQQCFQLKGSRASSMRIVPDGAYRTMLEAVLSASVPHLLLMRYSPDWTVRDLFVVPAFFLTPDAIVRREPLRESARRAGWEGCNISLQRIPPDGKIAIVAGARPVPRHEVRQRFARTQTLAQVEIRSRGWTLDVLAVLRQIGAPRFNLDDVYAFAPQLAELHPGNRHVEAKIRQQLQILRDLGFVVFEGRGRYRLTGQTAG
ncbi:MAG: DpnI domain-containing protein [Armatimonadota bacterium]